MIWLVSGLGPSIPSVSAEAAIGITIIGGGLLYLAWQVVFSIVESIWPPRT